MFSFSYWFLSILYPIGEIDEIIFAMNIWDYQFDYNGHSIIFNLFLFVIAVLRYKSECIGNRITVKGNYGFVYLLLVLFATFAYAEADFYHYQFHYDMMKHYDIESLAEPIYFLIAKNLPDNYFVWRFSIWGSAAFFMILALKKVGVCASYAGLMMPLFFWHQFSITRGALGLCIITLALTYCMDSKEKLLIRVISIMVLCTSVFFHNSIAVFLLFIPIALLLPLNSKVLRLSIFLFPFLYCGIILLTNNVMNLDVLAANTEKLAEHYIEGQHSEKNFWGVACDLLNFSGQLLMLYLSIRFVLRQKEQISSVIVFLIKYGYVLVYMSFLFYGQSVSSFISSRFLHASTFPLIVVYSYYIQHHKIARSNKVAISLLGLYAFYELIYPMYKWW